ncbi:MAG: 50S ribosomal protein L19e [Nitrososphaerota archaeon]|jgi:large subunit ribosomal protein L19e|nr:50S ribosomal protein L19e [Nitrososphaerota archaeon]MDG7040783.1 50S ribosomal protein L19e [Nitrososphaerota archaeon]MDG7043341.1 50S ribosomal protein L19e [Nitrososphaerota archaeon]MDG7046561.1 50S ribosomal protein L19e [Nitrososphaerota archaeon]MDG7047810.1 50S ribosomal protein L19e [Nitrososphaerota archaeon]
MQLRNKRALAAKVMKIGKNKVRFDTKRLDSVDEAAFTRVAIRRLVNDGSIYRSREKGQTKVGKARKRRGEGSRKGKKGARLGRKERWVSQVRTLRAYLKGQKPNVNRALYWKAYGKIKGGEIRTIRRLKAFMEGSNL